jgi:hypothetical protein
MFVQFRRNNAGAYATDSTINANVFFSFQNNLGGVVGIGWLQSTCASPFYRSSVVEWLRSDTTTGQVN